MCDNDYLLQSVLEGDFLFFHIVKQIVTYEMFYINRCFFSSHDYSYVDQTTPLRFDFITYFMTLLSLRKDEIWLTILHLKMNCHVSNCADLCHHHTFACFCMTSCYLQMYSNHPSILMDDQKWNFVAVFPKHPLKRLLESKKPKWLSTVDCVFSHVWECIMLLSRLPLGQRPKDWRAAHRLLSCRPNCWLA